jgi:sugar lactone lactonase YvrE
MASRCDILAGVKLMLLAAVMATAGAGADSEATRRLRALMDATPLAPLRLAELALEPSLPLEMVSSVAVDGGGLIYILQRGDKADPIVVASPEGRVLRSFGRGLYTIPHSIRIDRQGNVWTVDAGDSTIRQFTPLGRQLRRLAVELPAQPKGPFCGAADIAFAANGDFYVADGYQNARIVQFDAAGRRIREFGTPGTGPGELDHPHAVAVAPNGDVLVADRENGRIQRFSASGRWLGLWDHLGKTFSLKFTPGGQLWIGTQPRDVPNGAEGWLVEVDAQSGKPVRRVDAFGHSVEVTADGRLLTGRRPGSVLVFRPE